MPFTFEWHEVSPRRYYANLTVSGHTATEAVTVKLSEGKVIFTLMVSGKSFTSEPKEYRDLKTVKDAAEFWLIYQISVLEFPTVARSLSTGGSS